MILTNRQSDNVGIYLRLSRDDGDKIESDSIHSQRELIKDFIGRNSAFKYKKEYVDDGYTGTNFDRPGFARLMEDVRKGRGLKPEYVEIMKANKVPQYYIEGDHEAIWQSAHLR